MSVPPPPLSICEIHYHTGKLGITLEGYNDHTSGNYGLCFGYLGSIDIPLWTLKKLEP